MKSFRNARRLPLAIAAIASIAVAASPLATSNDPAGDESSVIAYVNGSPLTRKQFERAWHMETVSFAVLKATLPTPGSSEYASLRRRVATLIVRRRILRLEAKARGITVGNSELGRLIEALVADRFDGDKSALHSDLSHKGILPHEFRESIRDQTIEQRLFDAVTRDITVSTGAIRRYYVAHQEEFKIGYSRRIAFASFGSRDEAELMRRESDKERALPVDQVQTAMVDSRRVSPTLWRVVADTKSSTLSAPVKSGEAWYLIMPVEPVRRPRLLPLREAQEGIHAQLLRAEKRRVFEGWVRQAAQTRQVRYVDESLDSASPQR